jgi:membrane-associated protein
MPLSDSLHAVAQNTRELALNPLDGKELISTFGMYGVFAILFAETGLLIGFFLPGDSLLFLAGVAASPVGSHIIDEPLNLAILLIGAPICAIVGTQLGYFLGAKYGRQLFDRPNSKLFKKEYVNKAEYYFEKFGPAKAVVLARFIPIVRTFLNPLAGILKMPVKRFFLWNVIGGLIWTDGVLLAGYFLGDAIPESKIDRYLLPVIIIVILISAIPIFIEITRTLRSNHRSSVHPTSDKEDKETNQECQKQSCVSQQG